jgi:uncharacterized phage protein (TIGR02220 family)
MARNRMIRPEFWEDSKIAKLRYPARLLFIAMWNFADDEGFLSSDPEWLKIKCFPYDKINVMEFMEELEKAERIELKNDIIKIKNFLKYQIINRPRKSDLSKQFSEHSVSTHGVFTEHSHTKMKLNEVKLSEGNITSSEVKSNETHAQEVLDHFNTSCKKSYTLTADRDVLIRKKLKEGYTVDQLKKAITAFSRDTWAGRADHMDLIYAIGKQNGKADNLEKWLNIGTKDDEMYYKSEA